MAGETREREKETRYCMDPDRHLDLIFVLPRVFRFLYRAGREAGTLNIEELVARSCALRSSWYKEVTSSLTTVAQPPTTHPELHYLSSAKHGYLPDHVHVVARRYDDHHQRQRTTDQSTCIYIYVEDLEGVTVM